MRVKDFLGDLTPGELWALIGVVFTVLSGTFGLGVKIGPLLGGGSSSETVLTETSKAQSAAGVIEFVNVTADPEKEEQLEKDYQRIGYSADLTQLNNLVHGFLVTASKTSFSDAQSFYADIDFATGIVIRRAKNTFASPGDKIEDQANYNWNVYAVPSLFRIYIAELRKAHSTGLSGEQISYFGRKFDEWRSNAPR
jgi:hypothetical protein